MNALDLLKEDHDRVDKLFQKVEATDEGEHMPLFEQIMQELEVHTHIEEVIFYPQIKEQGDEELKKLVNEGVEEHRQAKMFLRELDALKSEGERFEAKLQVLMEDIKHHVQEEERNVWAEVKENFSDEERAAMNRQFEAAKKKVRLPN
jgi:hemerythrin superfamily protein